MNFVVLTRNPGYVIVNIDNNTIKIMRSDKEAFNAIINDINNNKLSFVGQPLNTEGFEFTGCDFNPNEKLFDYWISIRGEEHFLPREKMIKFLTDLISEL